jgi:GT2 family glycosyltransferase
MLNRAGATPILLAGRQPPARGYDADIVILTMNRFAETLEAVGSALRQTGIKFHVTVLDQGSSPAVQADYAIAFAGRDNLGYYAIPQNRGVAGGRNLLAKLGHGRIIVTLDNDAVFANDLIAAEAVLTFDENPKLGALGFKILQRDGIHLDHFSWGYPLALKPLCDCRFETTTFVGAGHAIRRQTWDEAGGYDEAFFFTWEEYDFCLSAIALGWLVQYDGALAVIHKVSPEARIGWNAARVEYAVRNRLFIARKWGASWLGLAPRIAGYLLKGALNRRLRPTVNGIQAAIANDAAQVKQKMPPAMRRYIARNETRHRGSIFARMRCEIFCRIPADP